MKKINKSILLFLIPVLTLFSIYFYVSTSIDFRFVIENRTGVYLWKEDKNVLHTDKDNIVENLMYCENIVQEKDGVECGFYLNGIKFSIGEGKFYE